MNNPNIQTSIYWFWMLLVNVNVTFHT